MCPSLLDQTIDALAHFDDGTYERVSEPVVRAWIDKLTRKVYEDMGVVTEQRGLALHDFCPGQSACWSPVCAAGRPTTAARTIRNWEVGSMIWPWVGRNYRPGGVCLVGLNQVRGRDYSTPAVEYRTLERVRKRLLLGCKTDSGSAFHYRTLATASAIINRGGDVEPTPQSLVSVLDHVVKIQAVKCSPIDAVVARSQPSSEMQRSCPPRYLARELKILQPGTIITFGNVARDGVLHAGKVSPGNSRPELGRATVEIDGRPTTFLRLYHPAARGKTSWKVSQQRLLDVLKTEGL